MQVSFLHTDTLNVPLMPKGSAVLSFMIGTRKWPVCVRTWHSFLSRALIR
jgi:hypothetical protein